MENKHDLTRGEITPQLIKLALPLMGTAFIQMSYNLMDMFWLGKLSTDSLAAAASSGYITWLAMAFVLMIRTGTEIGVGHSVGARKEDELHQYISTALTFSLILGGLYALVMVLFRVPIIGFFNFKEEIIRSQAHSYLTVVALGYPFFFINPILGGIYHGAGNSKTPFLINSVGLVMNMVLDPVFIFGLKMGVQGAALATALANFTISLIYYLMRHGEPVLFSKLHLLREFSVDKLKRILNWGYPSAINSASFTLITAVVSRMITSYSSGAFAAYEVGVQIEAIGWMVFGGMSTSIGAFVAQNYGSGQFNRMMEGYRKGTIITTVMGAFAMVILYFFSGDFIRLFIKEDGYALQAGMRYLMIIALSQVFASWEGSTQGGFNGIGKTKYPSMMGICCNALRIPLAIVLQKFFGLDGIWIAIAVAASLKGILLRPLFWWVSREDEMEETA